MVCSSGFLPGLANAHKPHAQIVCVFGPGYERGERVEAFPDAWLSTGVFVRRLFGDGSSEV